MRTNGWNEYKQLFLSELEENKKFRKEIKDILDILRLDVAGLKLKATIAGGVAGIVVTGIVKVLFSAFR